MPKIKEIQKVVQKLARGQEAGDGGGGGSGPAAYEPVQKHKVYLGDLMNER